MRNLPTAPYTVLIADASPIVRLALRWALEGMPECVVVGEASRGEEALTLTDALQPDIVLLETDLDGLDGCTAARAMKSRPKSPRILFLTIHSDATAQQRCFEAGGDAFLPKSAGWLALRAMIRTLLEEGDDENAFSLSDEKAAE